MLLIGPPSCCFVLYSLFLSPGILLKSTMTWIIVLHQIRYSHFILIPNFQVDMYTVIQEAEGVIITIINVLVLFLKIFRIHRSFLYNTATLKLMISPLTSELLSFSILFISQHEALTHPSLLLSLSPSLSFSPSNAVSNYFLFWNLSEGM